MADNQYADLYQQAGEQYGVDPELLMAQGQAESSGNPAALGPQTPYGRASGLAQLIPATAKALGVTDPKKPEQAIPAQAKLMAENLKRYKDTEKALMAYHGGTDEKNWGPKTRAYPGRVFQYYKGKDKQVAQAGQPNDDVMSSIEAAADEANKADDHASTGASTASSPDDLMKRLDQIHEEVNTLPEAEQARAAAPFKEDKKKPGVLKDIALTVPSALVRGAEAIPQIPAMGANAINAAVADLGVGTYNLFADEPVSDERRADLIKRVQPFHTGNTFLDPLAQSAQEIVTGKPQPANPLTGDLLHDPETVPGKLANAAVMAGTGGVGSGVKALPSIFGGLASEIGHELSPDSAVLPLVSGLAGFGAGHLGNSLITSARAPGRQALANNILDSFAGHDPLTLNLGPNAGPALTSGGLAPGELVAGSKPTLAQLTGNPGVAALEDALQNSPNSRSFTDRAAENQQARDQHLAGIVKTPADLAAAEDAIDTQADTDLGKIFANSKPSQAPGWSPAKQVVDKIDEILKGPSGLHPAVAKAMSDVKAALYDSQGDLVSDPETLYQSTHKAIRDLLSGKDLTKAYGRESARELRQVKTQLENAIEEGAPGFKKYLSDYATAKKPIEAMKYLQGLELRDAQGNITLAKVQGALKKINKQRAEPGMNPAKSLTADHLKGLTALRDDLLRESQTASKALPQRNSATTKRVTAASKLESMLPGRSGILSGKLHPEIVGGGIGATLGASTHIPGAGTIGATLGATAGNKINNFLLSRGDLVRDHLTDMVLNPHTVAPRPGPGGTSVRSGAPTKITISPRHNSLVRSYIDHLNRSASYGPVFAPTAYDNQVNNPQDQP